MIKSVKDPKKLETKNSTSSAIEILYFLAHKIVIIIVMNGSIIIMST
jgi:hypothetical protein